jgi:hypothetical protein
MVQAIPSHPARGRRRKGAGAGSCPGIPVVNDAHEIVAWTGVPPVVENGRLRHAEAERLLGGAIFCTQIALMDPDQIRRAGGPTGWVGPWRCLALCRAEHGPGLEQPRSALFAAPPGMPPAKPEGHSSL